MTMIFLSKQLDSPSYKEKRKCLGGLFFILILLVSCESIPEGIPPKGPLVQPPSNLSVLGKREALNRMITSICVNCDHLTNRFPPARVCEDFGNEKRAIDELSRELWRKLEKDRLIKPVSEVEKKTADYCLYSRFTEISNDSKGDRRVYKWVVEVRAMPKNRMVWKKELDVSVEHK